MIVADCNINSTWSVHPLKCRALSRHRHAGLDNQRFVFPSTKMQPQACCVDKLQKDLEVLDNYRET